MGNRLQARSLILSAGSLVLAAGAAVVGLLLTGTPWTETAVLLAALLPLAAVSLAAAHVMPRLPLRLPLHGHFAAAAVAAVATGTTAVAVGAKLMFVSRHDLLVVLVVLVFAAIVALRIASVLAMATVERVQRLRDALSALAAGRLDGPVPESGPLELAQLAESANRMATDLAAAMAAAARSDAARRRLVAGVSHDLRSPIASMQLLVEAVTDGIVTAPEEVADYQRRLHTHLRHLSGLVDDLFELARMDAGDVTWRTEPVPVDELVREAVDAFRPEARERQISLTEHVAGGTPTVVANPEKLERVLFNLVRNAVEHTPDGGAVAVSARRAEEGVRVEVRDTGPGVASDDAERVFEPFFRGLAETTGRRRGSGLGLAIARSIVEAHDGRIWLEASGHGATFAFTIPAADLPALAGGRTAASGTATSDGPAPGRDDAASREPSGPSSPGPGPRPTW